MSDLVKLAQLVLDAYKLHEASWVRPEGRVMGEYTIDKYDAIDMTISALKLDPDLYGAPARLMLHWTNDSMEWAEKTVAAAKSNCMHEAYADQAALAQLHLHVEAGGLVQDYRPVQGHPILIA